MGLPYIPFHTIETAFVHGRPNHKYFGVENLVDFPDMIMTTNRSVFFNGLGKLEPVVPNQEKDVNTEEENAIWKVFFNKVPNEIEVRFYPKKINCQACFWTNIKKDFILSQIIIILY